MRFKAAGVEKFGMRARPGRLVPFHSVRGAAWGGSEKVGSMKVNTSNGSAYRISFCIVGSVENKAEPKQMESGLAKLSKRKKKRSTN